MRCGPWNLDLRHSPVLPLESIRQQGEGFHRRTRRRKILVYIDPRTSVRRPVCRCSKRRLKGKEYRLDNGFVVVVHVASGSKGKAQRVERPQQIFTRWYGFSLPSPERRSLQNDSQVPSGLHYFFTFGCVLRGADLCIRMSQPRSLCDPNPPVANLNFTLKDMNGKPVALSAHKGRVLLLDFWAT